MRSLEVSLGARRDILDIADYLGDRSDDARHRFFAESDECFRSLAVFPNVGRVVKKPKGRGTPLRSYAVSGRFWRYIVYYRVFTHSVRIVRVLHGARNVRAILRLPR